MNKKLVLIIALAMMLVLGTVANAFAAGESADTDSEKGYDYTVFVYSGNQGTFKGTREWSKTCSQGEMVTFNKNDVKVTNDKYYVRGFKVTGHDNDETSGSSQITFNGGTDVSYVVSYAIKGDMVPYRVDYVTTSGASLGSDTFYGMIGDKPVVSFKYFEGYLPDAYNKAKTITGNADEDVFTFTYSGNGSAQTDQNGAAGDGTAANDTNGGNGAAGNGGNAAGNGNGINANPPGTAGNPAGTNTATINDSDTPLAGVPQYEDLDDQGKGFLKWIVAGAIGAGLLALILLILFVLRRRKQFDEVQS